MTLAERIAATVTGLARDTDRVLVAIDGPDCAGKTTLADRLAALLRDPVAVVRVSVDRFHRPAAQRRARGSLSPDGYYLDAFDHPTFADGCLARFAAGAARVRTGSHDLVTDLPVDEFADVPPRAVLVADGVFLLRPQLRGYWTYAVRLEVSPAEALRRATVRDLPLFGSVAEIERRYRERYLPAQERYSRECDPVSAADLVWTRRVSPKSWSVVVGDQ